MIKIDFTNVSNKVIFEEGLDLAQSFNEYAPKIQEIITNLNMRKDKPGSWLQWMNLGYNEETVWYVKEFAAMVDGRFDNVLVLGIGGSALGAQALSEALLKPYWNLLDKEQRENLPKIFFLDNIDPDQINALLDMLDLKKTLVNVITKSGSTAETMSQFMIIKDRLYNLLGDDYRKNIVATTDKQVGILRQLANEEGYKTFVVPDVLVRKEGYKICGLQEPTKKMSKSDRVDTGSIFIEDSADDIRKKVKRAVTDSENEVRYDPTTKPGVSNLLTIFATLSGTTIDVAENHFKGCNYGTLKTEVAEKIVEVLSPSTRI